jgi:hypothetical protein
MPGFAYINCGAPPTDSPPTQHPPSPAITTPPTDRPYHAGLSSRTMTVMVIAVVAVAIFSVVAYSATSKHPVSTLPPPTSVGQAYPTTTQLPQSSDPTQAYLAAVDKVPPANPTYTIPALEQSPSLPNGQPPTTPASTTPSQALAHSQAQAAALPGLIAAANALLVKAGHDVCTQLASKAPLPEMATKDGIVPLSLPQDQTPPLTAQSALAPPRHGTSTPRAKRPQPTSAPSTICISTSRSAPTTQPCPSWSAGQQPPPH